MLKILKSLIAFTLLSGAAQAQTVSVFCSDVWKYPVDLPLGIYDTGGNEVFPDNGWYNAGWHGVSKNEANDGSWGVNIEIQRGDLAFDGYLFGAAFVPDEDGNPTYRVFNGPITLMRNAAWLGGGDVAVFEGAMFEPRGGTCIGCEHQEAEPALPAQEGDIKITWHDNRSATLEWAGKSIRIAHWQWGDNIGLDHIDWIQGKYLTFGDYGFFNIIGHANGADAPQFDARYRSTGHATITRTTNIPQTLQGNGWVFYDIAVDQVFINTTNNGGFSRAGQEETGLEGYLLVYKPESDQMEIYLRPNGGSFFNNVGTDGFPVMRAFVKSQYEIQAYGLFDPAGTQSPETLGQTYLKMYRLPDGWEQALVVPAAPHVSLCEQIASNP